MWKNVQEQEYPSESHDELAIIKGPTGMVENLGQVWVVERVGHNTRVSVTRQGCWVQVRHTRQGKLLIIFVIFKERRLGKILIILANNVIDIVDNVRSVKPNIFCIISQLSKTQANINLN